MVGLELSFTRNSQLSHTGTFFHTNFRLVVFETFIKLMQEKPAEKSLQ